MHLIHTFASESRAQVYEYATTSSYALSKQDGICSLIGNEDLPGKKKSAAAGNRVGHFAGGIFILIKHLGTEIYRRYFFWIVHVFKTLNVSTK